MKNLLAVRLDNAGDVVLTGPAVRALARDGAVTMLAGPMGAAAARLLPGVIETIEFEAPWISSGVNVDPTAHRALVELLASRRFDEAVVFTSSHQSSLPAALLCKLAGIDRVAAISHDFAGTLVDVVVRGDPDLHEVLRNLQLVEALDHVLEPEDPPVLRVVRSAQPAAPAIGPYVVVHPGASVPARTLEPELWMAVVDALQTSGVQVVVTGNENDRTLGRSHPKAVDLRGRTGLAELVEVLAGAAAVCVGNTGPMHLAAAVGTPVVAVFAPTVPLDRWRPWGVPHVVLGDQAVACAGCRSRRCPLDEQWCLASVSADSVVAAVQRFVAVPAAELVSRLS